MPTGSLTVKGYFPPKPTRVMSYVSPPILGPVLTAQGSEKYLIDGPPDYIVMVFMATFSTAEFNERRAGMDDKDEVVMDCDAADDLNELASDDREHYRTQVTKWIKGSLEALQDPMWWFFLHVSHRAREPIRHLFNILSKYGSWHSSKAFKEQSSAAALPVVDLLTRRLPQLDAEFVALGATIDSWVQEIIEKLQRMSVWCNHDNAAVDSACMKAIAIRVVLQNHCAFDRSILKFFNRRLGLCLRLVNIQSPNA